MSLQSLWDKFEYKGLVCFTGYKDRYDDLLPELERVGIKDIHPHWDFPNPYVNTLLDVIPMSRFNKKRSCFFIGINNYRAIATAYHLGHNTCLIMEDDVRFLKDLTLLETILDTLPPDFDLALLDYGKPCSLSEKEWISIFRNSPLPQKHWVSFTNLRSTGCYAMSRKCMEKYLQVFEAPASHSGLLRNPDWYFNKEYLGPSMNLYAAYPSIALQYSFKEMHCPTLDPYYSLHSMIGIHREMYAGF